MTDWTVLGDNPVPLAAATVFENAQRLQQIASGWRQDQARALANADQVVQFWRGSAGAAWTASQQRVGRRLLTPSVELDRAADLLRRFGSEVAALSAEAISLLTKARSMQEELDSALFDALGSEPLLPDPAAEHHLMLQRKLGAVREQAAQLRQTYDAARRRCIRSLDELGAFDLLRPGQAASDRELAVLAELSTAELDGGVDRLLRGLPAGLRAGLFADLSPGAASHLTELDPALGELDGIPLSLRGEANRRQAEADLRGASVAGDQRRVDFLQSLLQPGSSLVLYEPASDHYAVLWGDPHSTNVAVFVPGVGSDATVPSWIRDAKTLNQASGAAVLMWKGYSDPGGTGTTDIAQAAFTDRAREGAGRLTAFCQDGLQLSPEQQLTVVAHSYGSVVAGVALADDGLRPNRVVVAGSPGMTVDSEAGLHMKPGQFFAEHAPGDFVANSLAGFGTDPASPDFGGVRLATNGAGYPRVQGHSDYFIPGSRSIHSLAAAVVGHVTPADEQTPTTADNLGQLVGDAAYPGREFIDQLAHSVPGPGAEVAHIGDMLDNNVTSVSRYVIEDPGGAIRKLTSWLP